MPVIRGIAFIFIILVLPPTCLYSQVEGTFIDSDTISMEETDTLTPVHSPQRASMYSAVLPGLGQVYNKQYWKIPVIYAAGAGIMYFLLKYSKDYDTYYKAYSDYHDGNEYTNSFLDLYFWEYKHIDKVSSLKSLKDNSRRWRDLDFIILGGLYILNIIDANVSAQFKNYNVDEDLSIKIEPAFNRYPYYGNAVGFRLNIKF